jgi:DNA-binding transcriptional LysR family regulator
MSFDTRLLNGLNVLAAIVEAVAQIFELGAESMLASGVLVNPFLDWTDELFPLYALHPSKNLPPAKVRVFLDFILEAVDSKLESARVNISDTL